MATQNECNHIITIGYLKAFVNGLIQDSVNGSIKNVDWSYLPSSARTDTYCPTYAQLTEGNVVQNYKSGSSPNSNIDGIIIGGTYAENQCVKQEDLSLMYTRFSGLTISSNSNSIDKCGGSVTLSYIHKYNITTKTMKDCTTSSASTSTTIGTSDTVDDELTWSKGSEQEGSFSYPTFSMPKNGTLESSARYTDIKASVEFRGTTNNSNTIRITQDGISGSYSYLVRTYNVATALTANRISSETFGCNGGTYSANAVGKYDIHKVMAWKNDCGDVFDGVTTDITDGTGSVTLPTQSGTFASKSCPTLDCSGNAVLTFTWSGLTDVVTFRQEGTNACCMCTALTLTTDVVSFGCNSYKKTVTYAHCNGIHDIALSWHDSTAIAQYFSVTLNTSTKEIIVTPIGSTLPPSPYSQTFKLVYGDDTTQAGVRNCEKIITITTENTTDAYNVNIIREEMCSGSNVIFMDYDVNINIVKK